MSDAQILAVIRGIVMKHARIRPPHIEEGHVLGRDLGFDSLAFLLTLSDLEDRLGFHFPLEKVDELRDVSVRDLVRWVSKERAPADRGVSGASPAPS